MRREVVERLSTRYKDAMIERGRKGNDGMVEAAPKNEMRGCR